MREELLPYLEKAEKLIQLGYMHDWLGPFPDKYRLARLLYQKDKAAGRLIPAANTALKVILPPPF